MKTCRKSSPAWESAFRLRNSEPMKNLFIPFALLLLTLLLPLRGEPQHAPQQAPPPQEERKDAPLPTVVLISLPACVTAVMEDPQRAERLFLPIPIRATHFFSSWKKRLKRNSRPSEERV